MTGSGTFGFADWNSFTAASVIPRVSAIIARLNGRSCAALCGLAMMIAARGVALGLTGENSVRVNRAAEGFMWLGRGRLLGVPVPVWLAALAFAIGWVVLRYTRFGRHVYAVGGNPEAARLAGLNVGRITLSVYVIIGFFAGLAGFVLSARLNSAEAVAGIGYELTVIASVVIGGTSLFGGRGSVWHALLGALVIGSIANGMDLLALDSAVKYMITGAVLLVAVVIDAVIRTQRERAGASR